MKFVTVTIYRVATMYSQVAVIYSKVIINITKQCSKFTIKYSNKSGNVQ